jgi:hypothetical protein
MFNSWMSVRWVLLALAIGGLCRVATANGDDGLQAEEASASLMQTSADPSGEGLSLAEWTDPPTVTGWTFDYRTRWLFNSRTSYEFGQPPYAPVAYAPLSRLDWSLNSCWHGFQIGRRQVDWGIQFEWLAPMESTIHGTMDDYDWLDSAMPDHLSSLSSSALRWNEGQMLDLGGEFCLGDSLLGMPVEVWPMAGFRFQRFAMTAHDGLQVIGDDPMVPAPGTPLPGDLITFNQQYYISYVGGQLRWTTPLGQLPPIACTFQGDWGGTAGYNVDHHLFYENFGIHRYTMENTRGGAVHFALAAEMFIRRWLSLGVQLDHLEIHTTGSHRWLTYDDTSVQTDETWRNGVKVTSNQNTLTAFLRANF